MITNFAILSGLLASILHIVTGIDHLATITPIVIETKYKSWVIGLWWGLGHTVGIFGLGLLFSIFKGYIPIDDIHNYSDQILGLILIGIGVWGLYRLYYLPYKRSLIGKQTIVSASSIGLVQGLASLSHVIFFLPALSFKNKLQTLEYILGFCMGTILIILLYTFILEKLIYRLKVKDEHSKTLNRVSFWSSLFACGVGLFLVFHT